MIKEVSKVNIKIVAQTVCVCGEREWKGIHCFVYFVKTEPGNDNNNNNNNNWRRKTRAMDSRQQHKKNASNEEARTLSLSLSIFNVFIVHCRFKLRERERERKKKQPRFSSEQRKLPPTKTNTDQWSSERH